MFRKYACFLIAILLCCMPCASASHIVTTCFPCYDIARAVTGGEADVTMLIKPGMEVHTYEPSPADILTIANADLFLCIGGESETWVEQLIDSLGSDAPVVVRLMDSVNALAEEGEEDELDEHIWTSPKNLMRMLDATEQAIGAALPEQAAQFFEFAAAYRAEIEAIDETLEAMVASCETPVIVCADRFPFLYLTNDYHIGHVAAFASCTAETEPSPKKMVELIDAVKTNDLPVIYIIEMSNGSVASVISSETGAAVETLHSMQTVTQEEFASGETCVSLMRKNLVALEKGLK